MGLLLPPLRSLLSRAGLGEGRWAQAGAQQGWGSSLVGAQLVRGPTDAAHRKEKWESGFFTSLGCGCCGKAGGGQAEGQSLGEPLPCAQRGQRAHGAGQVEGSTHGAGPGSTGAHGHCQRSQARSRTLPVAHSPHQGWSQTQTKPLHPPAQEGPGG